MNKFTISILILLFITLASSKITRKTWSIKNFRNAPNNFNYLTKFSMDIGSGNYKIRSLITSN